MNWLDPINLSCIIAYIVGAIGFSLSFMKTNKKKPRKKKNNPKPEFKPKLKMEDFPHV